MKEQEERIHAINVNPQMTIRAATWTYLALATDMTVVDGIRLRRNQLSTTYANFFHETLKLQTEQNIHPFINPIKKQTFRLLSRPM